MFNSPSRQGKRTFSILTSQHLRRIVSTRLVLVCTAHRATWDRRARKRSRVRSSPSPLPFVLSQWHVKDPVSVLTPPSSLALPQWHVKEPSRSVQSAGGRLHLDMHAPLTQRSQSGLTMPLSRRSVDYGMDGQDEELADVSSSREF